MFDEHERRERSAVEARELDRGDISLIARATGLSPNTISREDAPMRGIDRRIQVLIPIPLRKRCNAYQVSAAMNPALVANAIHNGMSLTPRSP